MALCRESCAHRLVPLELGSVTHFEIFPTPRNFWMEPNRVLPRSSAGVYDVVLHLLGLPPADQMVWNCVDDSRDCYVLQRYKLCCRWFQVRDNDAFENLHSETVAWTRNFLILPIGPHVPIANALGNIYKPMEENGCMRITCWLISLVQP